MLSDTQISARGFKSITDLDRLELRPLVDKPMRGLGLMQAIARVNRVFRDKPVGLVVDYLRLSQEVKQALATYTESGGTGRTAVDKREAIALMLEKHEVCLAMLHGFDFGAWTTGTPSERLGLLPAAQEHILAQEDGKDRFIATVREPTRAFALWSGASCGSTAIRRTSRRAQREWWWNKQKCYRQLGYSDHCLSRPLERVRLGHLVLRYPLRTRENCRNHGVSISDGGTGMPHRVVNLEQTGESECAKRCLAARDRTRGAVFR